MDVAFTASSRAYADNVLDTWTAYCANHERVPLHLTRNLVPLYRPHVPYPELLRADNLRHGRGSKRLVVCASYTDMVAARGQPVVLMEHGIGQTWPSMNSGSYAGGPGRDAVVCFLCPNEHSALANRIRNPHARVEVVGSPLLASLSQIPHTPTDPPTIATGWHWAPNPRMTPPEMQPAFPVYAEAFAELGENYRLLAHAHPRYQDVVFPVMRRAGIECEPDFRQVVARASALITDISSSGYIYAGLHRPTVWCNLPTYRPDVDAYPRFGANRLVPGIEVDTPNELGFAVQVALADPTHLQIARLDCNRAIFPLRDGRNAERAATVIADVAGTL